MYTNVYWDEKMQKERNMSFETFAEAKADLASFEGFYSKQLPDISYVHTEITNSRGEEVIENLKKEATHAA